jgi:hypothetical protein
LSSKKRQATEKDVRFALEYGREILIRTVVTGKGKFTYTISPSNFDVPEKVFQKLEREGYFETRDQGLFPGHPQSFQAKVRA